VNYYNEFDPFAAAWLRELIKDGRIPQGEVDERSIIEVEGSDLKGFTQCHFFAGIGGWSYALQLAGWESTRPVWTGSPPCQPFSVAGNQRGQDDERHLWPHFFDLIRQCKPAIVFGEQVASAIRTEWFDDLQADMEAEGYATAMAVLPACGIGAPHKRERLFFVADSNAHRWNEGLQQVQGELSERSGGDSVNSDVLAHSIDSGQSASQGRGQGSECTDQRYNAWGSGEDGSTVGNPDSQGLQEHGQPRELHLRQSNGQNQSGLDIDPSLSDKPLAFADSSGLREQSESGILREDQAQPDDQSVEGCSSTRYVYCRDGKYRQIPTEPALFPLAHGIPNRVGLLRGAGNAIVPQVAAEIIKAVM